MESYFLLGKGNTHAELAKKVFDIAIVDSYKFGKKLHLIRTPIPLATLILGMLGVFLQALTIILEPNKPWYIKLASYVLLAFVVAALGAVFMLSNTLPAAVLFLSASILLANIIIETINLCLSLYRFIKFNFQLNQADESPSVNVTSALERLHELRASLMRELSIALDTKSEQACEQLIQKIIACDKQECEIKYPEFSHALEKQKLKKDLLISCIAWCIAVGSAITTITGLLLTPIYPLAGIITLGLGAGFDFAGLARHVYIQSNHIRQTKEKQELLEQQKECILTEAQSRNDYARVIKSLGGANKSITNLPLEIINQEAPITTFNTSENDNLNNLQPNASNALLEPQKLGFCSDY